MDRVAYVENQLNTFKDSLTLYQQQTKAWYAQAADTISHAADLPSLMGMDRTIKVGDTRKTVSMTDADFTSNVARCPLEGPLTSQRWTSPKSTTRCVFRASISTRKQAYTTTGIATTIRGLDGF